MKVIYRNMDQGKVLNVWVYDGETFVCNLNIVKQRFGYSTVLNNPEPPEDIVPIMDADGVKYERYSSNLRNDTKEEKQP